MISIDGLAVEFGGESLFSDVFFVVNKEDKIALMGKNCAGKSTLMKIIAGQRKPTRGAVRASKDVVIAYLPQHLLSEDTCSVFEETAKAFQHIHDMRAELDRLNEELLSLTDSIGCLAKASNTIQFTVVGLADAQELASALSPNPFRDRIDITLDRPVATDLRVELQDALGRTVLTRDYPAGTRALVLATGALPVGVYVLRMAAGGREAMRKLVKE